MSDEAIANAGAAHELLRALAEQLGTLGETYELVVIGGSALLALGLVDRPTRDVDVLGLRSGHCLRSAEPLPEPLAIARDRVARDFAVPATWLNSGPAAMLDLGLPDGFEERLERVVYGPALTVAFASRLDQVHFKLYAAVDHNGPSKHLSDLQTLNPTPEELVQSARWTRTHDSSTAHRDLLIAALVYFEVHDADLDL